MYQTKVKRFHLFEMKPFYFGLSLVLGWIIHRLEFTIYWIPTGHTFTAIEFNFNFHADVIRKSGHRQSYCVDCV